MRHVLKVLAVIALSSNINTAQADQTKPELNALFDVLRSSTDLVDMSVAQMKFGSIGTNYRQIRLLCKRFLMMECGRCILANHRSQSRILVASSRAHLTSQRLGTVVPRHFLCWEISRHRY